MTTIEERVNRLEVDMEEIKAILRATALQQQANTQAIAETRAIADINTQNIAAIGDRLDSFIYESQRVMLRLSESAARSEAAIESLIPLVQRLASNAEQDRNEFRSTTMALESMVSRLDALVNYLMRGG